MSNAIAQSRNPVIANLKSYLYLKEVHANTSLIGGKIIYNGYTWDEVTYNFVFPVPTLKYKTVNPDKTQCQK